MRNTNNRFHFCLGSAAIIVIVVYYSDLAVRKVQYVRFLNLTTVMLNNVQSPCVFNDTFFVEL